MGPTFPLFRLPDNAFVHVLGNMYFDHLLNISFVSTRARTLVTSTLLEADLINIKVSRFIDTEVRFRNKTTMNLYFYYDGNDQNAAQPVDDPNRLSPVDITLPVVAFLLFNYIPIHSSTPFNFIDWMNHIQTIFCFAKPPSVRFYHECERFDAQYLKEAIGNVDVLRVDSEQSTFASGEVYLKGIKCIEMNEEAKQEIREKHRLMDSVDMIKIKRKDGKIVVIGIKDSGDTLFVHFIVLD
ncbi:hypothetical protein CRE_06133 [Caenorhabditis remanei]|uniref:F-box domain-containing protein n=1 Tax=Caenorhabditis remanei TaxID=31234 RepID=E3NEC6_CAERE|nr:hypothetical protein CRE_06133 [Caenorhabditis remanei]